MFKGEIKAANEAKKIKRVVVVRLYSRPGQTDAKLSPNDYVREHDNYRYLLLFVPDQTRVPRAVQTPKDYFIFLNRLDKPDQIRWYKSLFTVSQDIEEWGFKSYEVFDLTGHADLEEAFSHLKKELSKRNIGYHPVKRFMEDLVNMDRGLPMLSGRKRPRIEI